MTHAREPKSPRRTGHHGQTRQPTPMNHEPRMTQEGVPSGLSLMPRSWALRMARIAQRLTSSHA